MLRDFSVVLALSGVLLGGCGSRTNKPVENVGGAHDVSGFTLRSLKGTRDGEILKAQALYGDDSRTLLVDLQFKVTPPTRLESGRWTGLDNEGSVQERSVTFLGGQSGPPSIGGRFDLMGPNNRMLYRITIPLQELKHPL